jgi:hypothetical protein
MKVFSFQLSVFSVIALTLLSCVETKTTVASYERGKPIGTHTVRQFLYGKVTNDAGLFDEATATNMDTGFKLLTQLTASLTTAYIAGSVQKVKELTAQLANSNATALQKQQAVLAAQTQAAAAGADLTKFGITNGLFKPAATTFVQP